MTIDAETSPLTTRPAEQTALEAQHWRAFLAQLRAAGGEPVTTGELAGQAYVNALTPPALTAWDLDDAGKKASALRAYARDWTDFRRTILNAAVWPRSGKAAARLLLDALHTITHDAEALRHFEREHHPDLYELFDMCAGAREWRQFIETLYAAGYPSSGVRDQGRALAEELLRLRAAIAQRRVTGNDH
jgi:hypothetical protein